MAACGEPVGGASIPPSSISIPTTTPSLPLSNAAQLTRPTQLHPWNQQPTITTYCTTHSIALEAYCPLVRNAKASDATLSGIASKHATSTQQVLLRYSLQKGWIPLPKSDNEGRIAKNADLYGFELDEGDMRGLDGLEAGGKEALVVAVDNEAVA